MIIFRYSWHFYRSTY